MNQIQKMSQKILSDRLKIQLGLALETNLDYPTLQAMAQQLKNERMYKLARVEASYMTAGVH